jgi:hypothetical protein
VGCYIIGLRSLWDIRELRLCLSSGTSKRGLTKIRFSTTTLETGCARLKSSPCPRGGETPEIIKRLDDSKAVTIQRFSDWHVPTMNERHSTRTILFSRSLNTELGYTDAPLIHSTSSATNYLRSSFLTEVFVTEVARTMVASILGFDWNERRGLSTVIKVTVVKKRMLGKATHNIGRGVKIAKDTSSKFVR